MTDLKAIIFDVDGTLAETEEAGHRVAFNQAFAETGLDWHWSVDLYGGLLDVAGGKERIRYYLQQYQPSLAAKLVAQGQSQTFVKQLHALKSQHYQQLLQQGLPLRTGVRRLLMAAQQAGVRLAIATTSAPQNVTTLLKTAIAPESLTWFELVAAGDIVSRKKPAPDIYDYVLNKMAIDPADCLVIEDSPQGLAAATQAGLRTVVTVNSYTRHYQYPQAALVLDHLGEPDQLFTAIAGDPGGDRYFTLALAQRLLRQ
ncbi:MAG: HAD-IA family hydrolase [Leptolyngbyaceae cyanobacterium SL_1_1]|nr:HAD-IA family hydrolase [Leptolyngbyaceae cyanobacterium RM1_1_2]NJO10876.1 HAD-IA family hydrolase [Leptolyngbyaceae cyanobacterium SL_1_1]